MEHLKSKHTEESSTLTPDFTSGQLAALAIAPSSAEDGTIRKRRRNEEELPPLSGLIRKFFNSIRGFSEEDLRSISKYYQPYLAYVIEYDLSSILQNLVTKRILTNEEAKSYKHREDAEGAEGVAWFVSDVLGKSRDVVIKLWEALAEEIVRFPSPNMKTILEEVAERGSALLIEIRYDHHGPELKTGIKELQDKHKAALDPYTRALEEQPGPGNAHPREVSFENRYTELMIINQYTRTRGETHHELLETGKKHAKLLENRMQEKCKRIWINQLFRRSPGRDEHPRIVVVSGVAGIGKTTMVQKFMFDWVRDLHYQRFMFVFLFKFRELNLIEEEEATMPLTRLIVKLNKHLNDPRLREILKRPESVLFVFDGLDEYKHRLDFTQKRLCSNPEDIFPIPVIVTSLITQTLLKGCSVLITSRPTALEPLDTKRVDRYAEILGFFPEQRKRYFMKFFDSPLGTKAFEYVEQNDIIYTMCYNPSYCWIICSALRSHFTAEEWKQRHAPKTITELFVIFITNILTNHKREADDTRGNLVKIGKMAYHGVKNRTLVFYDKFEMSTFGLTSLQSSPFLSGFMREILQRESCLEHTTYTFFHLTIQEFLAACYYFLDPSADVSEMLGNLDSCTDGSFEIFTRFLAGLCRVPMTEPLQSILGQFKTQTGHKVLRWLKERTERAVKDLQNKDGTKELLHIFQWLYETQNALLIRDSIRELTKLKFTNTTLSPLDCAVLGYVLNHGGAVKEIDLSSTRLTKECMNRLSPAFHRCHTLKLASSGLTFECCEDLASALRTNHSNLTELDLSSNDKLGDSGMRLLCAALKDPNCKLQTLKLVGCRLTSRCCEDLASALRTNHSTLTELDLGGNDKLGDSGVRLLCAALRDPNCKLQTLKLVDCDLTSLCCEDLASALCTNYSNLTELDLSRNDKLKYSGVKLLCAALRDPNCKLQKLGLVKCDLTSLCCKDLASALRTNHSNLTELDLSFNHKLGDSGVRLLCAALRDPNCKLQTLKLAGAGLTDGCAEFLSSALSTNRSLTELDLCWNSFIDSSVPSLTRLVQTCSSLKEIRLSRNWFSVEGERKLKSLQEELERSGRDVNVKLQW
ncbi:NACHT, LRR and PYD domains-containing protein 12-like [Acipenser ruthenus]|uniref:NACHT, LRR and PYD domains-containing protein 12-like n=1 Tax=Acipenser ruthenus TaxID=7906 RepID=UPI002740DF93|nr:NACHT, LRR and PYD domains-containing protein 12-like [Acipenser ruthenus]XP_058882714.1 NACHT, LRR and PYD domains-containing protein 12-like [Acipenser ruthenus]